MSITINYVQLKRKKLKNGEIPIYFRFTSHGKSYYLSSGISVHESDWNNEKQMIRKTNPRNRKLNNYLKKRLYKVKDYKLELEEKNSLSISKLKKFLETKSSQGIFDYTKEYIERLDKERRYSEWKHFKVINKQISNFLRAENIDPKSIDSELIENFQYYCLNVIGNNPNTTRKKLSQLRGFVKYLIKINVINSDPFQKVKKVSSIPVNKTRLSISQLNSIRKLSLEEYSDLWHVKNYFLYSLYNAGIRFSDICTLRWENVACDRLAYRMSKTSGNKSIKQRPEMLEILSFYDKTEKTDKDYIFPILTKEYKDKFALKRAISSKNTIVNRNLKIIAMEAGITENISFHVSRHSFSQLALQNGVGVYEISKALGHSKLETTQQYLNSFDEDLLDSAMDQAFSSINDN